MDDWWRVTRENITWVKTELGAKSTSYLLLARAAEAEFPWAVNACNCLVYARDEGAAEVDDMYKIIDAVVRASNLN